MTVFNSLPSPSRDGQYSDRSATATNLVLSLAFSPNAQGPVFATRDGKIARGPTGLMVATNDIDPVAVDIGTANPYDFGSPAGNLVHTIARFLQATPTTTEYIGLWVSGSDTYIATFQRVETHEAARSRAESVTPDGMDPVYYDTEIGRWYSCQDVTIPIDDPLASRPYIARYEWDENGTTTVQELTFETDQDPFEVAEALAEAGTVPSNRLKDYSYYVYPNDQTKAA